MIADAETNAFDVVQYFIRYNDKYIQFKFDVERAYGENLSSLVYKITDKTNNVNNLI